MVFASMHQNPFAHNYNVCLPNAGVPRTHSGKIIRCILRKIASKQASKNGTRQHWQISQWWTSYWRQEASVVLTESSLPIASRVQAILVLATFVVNQCFCWHVCRGSKQTPLDSLWWWLSWGVMYQWQSCLCLRWAVVLQYMWYVGRCDWCSVVMLAMHMAFCAYSQFRACGTWMMLLWNEHIVTYVIVIVKLLSCGHKFTTGLVQYTHVRGHGVD